MYFCKNEWLNLPMCSIYGAHFQTRFIFLQDISNYSRKEKDFFFPAKEEICKKKVVITTMVTAGRCV
jgi:hypothetical protein